MAMLHPVAAWECGCLRPSGIDLTFNVLPAALDTGVDT